MANRTIIELVTELEKYTGKYQISIQFWGPGNNNVFIDKDDVDLYSSGGFETAADAIEDAVEYLHSINHRLKSKV